MNVTQIVAWFHTASCATRPFCCKELSVRVASQGQRDPHPQVTKQRPEAQRHLLRDDADVRHAAVGGAAPQGRMLSRCEASAAPHPGLPLQRGLQALRFTCCGNRCSEQPNRPRKCRLAYAQAGRQAGRQAGKAAAIPCFILLEIQPAGLRRGYQMLVGSCKCALHSMTKQSALSFSFRGRNCCTCMRASHAAVLPPERLHDHTPSSRWVESPPPAVKC